MNVLIKAQAVSKEFYRNRGDSNIFYPVNNVDFTLEEGEIAVISGASGSGKTTFLNLISGILPPSDGKIEFLNKEIYTMKDNELSLFRNKNIGVIPQGQTAIHSLTVMENVLLPFTMYAKDKKLIAAKTELANTLLKKLQIDDLKDIMPCELSGGELRRMAVARALIMEPSVIIADEPTSDLDEVNTEIVLTILKEAAASKKGVIIVTHDKEVSEITKSNYKMKDGVLEVK